ncbi:MAG: hypothetical protein UX04_C0001G0025 [Microgenomates group bacterium GW2011_GWF2_45_18]|nr:MAG: hypothetical protein UW18_C0003G0206 [Microgenomates group bacterium GW2011_GWF1_44_10]KKU02254.1 MAG: hypothetical protein UX04_C0001G0025 [Microgenomates group bacterium GW2011_GWF2_45_18]OGJ41252.1 MAG: hypothetical protein A2378_01670 [Candidatus Pacebacteria bacterium RIFOXYB1_FULL_44_10]HAU99281.1 hypothetical protein [Candidatus Paceibacterota bacterium]HAX01812.1 hypothetical protein [Candidatus Paceibacterota bacterium]
MLLFLFLFVTRVLASSPPPLQLTEVMINPEGDDATEWIEILNTTDGDIQGSGWNVSDQYGATHLYSLNDILFPAQEYTVLSRDITGISLNNDKEEVVLEEAIEGIQRTGIVTSSPEGKSFSLLLSGWGWSVPTRGSKNDQLLPSGTPQPSSFPSPSPSPTASPLASPLPELSARDATQTDLRLSEVSACGTGNEWIEIENKTNEELSVRGMTLRDSQTFQYQVSDQTILPNQIFMIEWSTRALNNSGDTISIFLRGEEIDSYSYTSCVSGTSWQRMQDNVWIQASPTKKGKNIDPYETRQSTSDIERVADKGNDFSTQKNNTLFPLEKQRFIGFPQFRYSPHKNAHVFKTVLYYRIFRTSLNNRIVQCCFGMLLVHVFWLISLWNDTMNSA